MNRLRPFLLLLLLPAIAACEETVDPVLESDRVFSLYGYLDPASARQAVRVYEVASILAPTAPLPLAATVTTEDLATGVQHVWRDSVVQYANGTYGHVFWAPFQAEFGHRYRLRAALPDGRAARVEVQVPEQAAAEVLPARYIGRRVIIPVRWAPAPHLHTAEMIYNVRSAVSVNKTWRITIPYSPSAIKTGPAGHVVEVQLFDDAQRLFTQTTEGRLILVDATLRVFVAGQNWGVLPEELSPDVRAEPQVSTNVENGLGFVGAGYHAVHTWRPTREEQLGAGFVTEGAP